MGFEEEYNRPSDQARVLDQALGIGSEKDVGAGGGIKSDSIMLNGAQYVLKDEKYAAQADSPGGTSGQVQMSKIDESSQRIQTIGTKVPRDPIDVMTLLA